MRDKKSAPQEGRPAGLAAWATRQHGVIAIWQLNELGVTREGARRMVRAGRLHRLYRGVYAVGHRSLARHGRLMAAVLAGGPAAVASHTSAGWLHEIRRASAGAWHVTVPGSRRHKREEFELHSARTLHSEDRGAIDGIPCTSLARTLLDLADLLTQPQLERSIEEAERRGTFDARAVERACARGRGRSAVRKLRAAMALARPDPPKTRSELERDFLDFCRRHGIPEPSMNLWVAGQEVDAVWLDRKVAVELDSYEYHGGRAAFERDRVRSAELELSEFKHVRVTGERMERDAKRLAGHVRNLLGAVE